MVVVGPRGRLRSHVVGAPCCRVAMFVLSSWRCRLGTWSFAGAVSSLVGAGCRGHLFVVLSWCCVVHVIAVRRGWETDGYLLERPRRCGTDATSSPPSTRGCCCCPCCCPCVPWVLWANHGYWWWWPLAGCSGRRERLGSMVVVGREGLLIVCSLLMTTNRVSGFADARFGCSEEITTVIDLTLFP